MKPLIHLNLSHFALVFLEGISKPVVDFARSPSSLSKQREFWRIPLR